MRAMIMVPVPLVAVLLGAFLPALGVDPGFATAKQAEPGTGSETNEQPVVEPDDPLTIEEVGPVTPAVPSVTPPLPAGQAFDVPGPLTARVTARRVVTEQIRIVPIEIETPVTVRELRATANLGEVHGPDRVEAGLFRAHITLPTLQGPAVLLVIFETDGYAGYVRVPVWKAANLDVDTEAGAQVQVEIGDQTFGPVRAVGRLATVPVEIPPGVRSARVVARDAAGNETTRTINLPTARFPLAVVRPPAQSLLADDSQTHPVLVAVTDEDGMVPGSYQLETETGALGEPAEIQPGLRLYSWRPSRELGEHAFTVRQDDGVTTQTVTMTAGPATMMEIQAAPNILPANGLSTSTIYAGVSDGLGHYIDAGALDMSIAGGNVIAPPEQSGPVIIATVAAEQMIEGGEPPAAIVVRVQGGGYENSVAIRQFNPDARGLRLSAGATRMVADGESRTEIRVELLDGLGEPLPVSTRVEISAIGGTVPAEIELVEGNGSFSLQAGTEIGIVTIRAAIEDTIAHTTVTLDPGPPDHLRVLAEPDPGGGPGVYRVRTRLEDRFGNGVGGDGLPSFVGRANRGRLGEFVPRDVTGVEDVGWYEASFLLPEEERRGAAIEVAAGRWTAETRVGGQGTASVYLGVTGGYQHNLGDAGVFPARLAIGWMNAFGARGFLFGAELGYLGLRMSVVPEAGQSWKVVGDALAVHAVFGYRWPVASWLVLLGELGLGFQVGWFRLDSERDDSAAAADGLVAFSLGARITLGFPVGPGLIELQLAYDDARFDDVIQGNVGGLGGLLGYRLEV